LKCTLCNFRCGIDRSQETGRCGIDDRIYIAHYGLHRGEEPFLTGRHGSGTIFFAGCTLRCRFCQNYQISRWTVRNGLSGVETVTVEGLIEIFRKLESMGAANINLVSPASYALQIRQAIIKARSTGFALPFVYNTHGYDSIETIEAIKGIMDIYLPDFKYGEDETGKKFSGAPDMFSSGKSVIKAMYEQAGLLRLDRHGLAQKGIAIRHLVIPGHIENSFGVLDFLESIDRRIHLSLMSQFHPRSDNKDMEYPELNRTLYPEEYDRVVEYAHALGFKNLLTQEMESHEHFLPDFDENDVFET
jgi:putative pyruvate formate lyase activating enzyme